MIFKFNAEDIEENDRKFVFAKDEWVEFTHCSRNFRYRRNSDDDIVYENNNAWIIYTERKGYKIMDGELELVMKAITTEIPLNNDVITLDMIKDKIDVALENDDEVSFHKYCRMYNTYDAEFAIK